MPVRQAQPRDEPVIASVCAAAFFNEVLFKTVILPHSQEYPEDVVLYWHASIRRHWGTPSSRVLVATTIEEQNGDEKEKIVGVAVWQRHGDDDGKRKVEEEWIEVGPHTFLPLPSTPNRAADPTKSGIWAESFPYIAHHWTGARSSSWSLNVCCVDPLYQGHGFGRELVKWGLDKANGEGVHASVIASAGNDGFYLRCGYDEVVGSSTEGEGNPLRGVPGGSILFMAPKGISKDETGEQPLP